MKRSSSHGTIRAVQPDQPGVSSTDQGRRKLVNQRTNSIWYCGLLLLGCVSMAQGQAVSNSPEQEVNIDTYVNLLRQDVNSQKVAIISQLMQFTPEQAAAFWPVYTEYSKELAKIGDEKLAGIKEYAASYGSLTDEKANELAVKVLDLEGRRTAVKKTYYGKMKQAITPKMAARFLQIENQLLMIIDLQIAASLPIVE
jgi:hypothetical protein